MPFLQELFHYWEDFPPTHELVAAYLGYKPRRRNKEAPLSETDYQFAQVLGKQRVKTFDQLPLPVQEWLSTAKKTKNGT
jgi:hypothetical protein